MSKFNSISPIKKFSEYAPFEIYEAAQTGKWSSIRNKFEQCINELNATLGDIQKYEGKEYTTVLGDKVKWVSENINNEKAGFYYVMVNNKRLKD